MREHTLQLPLDDDMWPMYSHTTCRPPMTACAECGTVVKQTNAVRSNTEDFCSNLCWVVYEDKHNG